MYVDSEKMPNLTLDKIIIIEYLCFKYKNFTSPPIDDILNIFISNENMILIIYKKLNFKPNICIEKPFDLDDYKNWLRIKKIEKCIIPKMK